MDDGGGLGLTGSRWKWANAASMLAARASAAQAKGPRWARDGVGSSISITLNATIYLAAGLA